MRLAVDERGMQIDENLLWLFGGLDSAHPESQIMPPMTTTDWLTSKDVLFRRLTTELALSLPTNAIAHYQRGKDDLQSALFLFTNDVLSDPTMSPQSIFSFDDPKKYVDLPTHLSALVLETRRTTGARLWSLEITESEEGVTKFRYHSTETIPGRGKVGLTGTTATDPHRCTYQITHQTADLAIDTSKVSELKSSVDLEVDYGSCEATEAEITEAEMADWPMTNPRPITLAEVIEERRPELAFKLGLYIHESTRTAWDKTIEDSGIVKFKLPGMPQSFEPVGTKISTRIKLVIGEQIQEA
jgi:hypothetical protein